MNAAHTPESIMNLGNGFMQARILLTGAELDLFTLLAQKPLPFEEIVAKKKADHRGMGILLDVLSAMGLLVKNDVLYQTEPSIAPFLSADSRHSLLPMILHLGTLWQSWSKLTDIVQGTAVPDREAPSALHKDHIRSFIGAMHAIASKTAPEVVAAIDPGSARRMIDVGGGSGSYTLAFLRAVPGMTVTLFDLPEVIGMARERIEAAGMTDRVTFIPGDFYNDTLPSGNDLALLSAIIHQNSPAQNLALYHKIFHSLNAGGRIVVRDHVMSSDRTRPLDGALFAVNMLAGTSAGATYTFDEIREGLSDAGFGCIRLVQSKGMSSLVEGFKMQGSG